MCGIHFTLSSRSYHDLDAKASHVLNCRGPDSSLCHKLTLETSSQPWYLTFHASVLSLRGNQIQTQPLIDQVSGSVLCWNGEAWRINNDAVLGNDTQVVFQKLLESSHDHGDGTTQPPHHQILKALADIAGPWAFVFYDAKHKCLYFGRDKLGRRSLVIDDSSLIDGQLTVASTGVIENSRAVKEVEADGLICIQLNHPTITVQKLHRYGETPTINRITPDNSTCLSNCPSNSAIDGIISHLKDSLQARVKGVPTYTANATTDKPSKVAILFSGGLDCTLLARITHDILPVDQPIDLLNVAFQNPRVTKAAASKKIDEFADKSSIYESCPDRITGGSSYQELQDVCPEREWRFVAVNIPYEEMLQHRPTIIQLMSPHNTEMDLSITMALYFAARGQGFLQTKPVSPLDDTVYTTTARVLLSGLGADELFGGYSRHVAAFARGGYATLIDELDLDFTRIGSRNLGRDDRVISHWGREIRYAFLDEDFVRYALDLPVWEKTGFRHNRQLPKHFEEPEQKMVETMEELDAAKMLLRCAAWKLGMKRVANEKKRAIQFGARTAKMHAGKTKGTDIVTEGDVMPS